MNTSIVRAFIATLTCSLAAVGCASQTDPAESAEDGTPASTASEENVDKVQQAVLLACGNDVPSSGFRTFPFNTLNWTERSGWKAGCVSFRINRNLSQPANVGFEAEALGDFPQFEGNWTAAKAQQCRDSYINVAMAQKAVADGSYPVQNNWIDQPPFNNEVHAVPNIVYDASSPTLFRITSCQAQKWRGAGCTWFPNYNYQRMDIRLVVNGNPNNPIGPARVHAMYKNDTHC